MDLLDYENQMFLDAFHQDGLLITARGLGMERIFINFLKLYCDPGNLVLVLNTTMQEEEYFMEEVVKIGTQHKPRVITADLSINDRHAVYMEGGVLFITSRILVVELLTERLPTDHVTGILVYKAHKVMESCQEAFILRLFRQRNKSGFIKAFSSSPQSFTAGFCHVDRVMKSLFVRKLFLWPRFHASVVAAFDKSKVDVVELHLHMTPAMVACQTALVGLIDVCIKELKHSNQTLDTDEITVENAITRSFEKVVQHHLDPVWHQLGSKTKQLISDIKTLRLILEYLTQYDCVNFYNLVYSVRTNDKTFGQNSGWMFTEAADSLFVHAKERVYGPSVKKKQTKTSQDDNIPNKKKKEDADIPVPILEECPKWATLKDVLAEIEEDNKSADPSLGPGRVLISAQDDRTCGQIKEYLCDGGQVLLRRLFNKTIGVKSNAEKLPEQIVTKEAGSGKGKSTKASTGLTLTQMARGSSSNDQPPKDAEESSEKTAEMRSDDAYYDILKSPFTVLHPLHGSSDPHSLTRTLHEVMPRYVILYDADMLFVRQLEVFRATHPGLPLRVYFLMYAGSTEEQRYLTTLRKEKEAFEYLIKEKATMVAPEEREGRLDNDPNLSRNTTPANATVNSRKGGQEVLPEQQKIIVDMREFRSELPALIHRRGIDIEPATIEVGDYILTPDICVERKSISDLVGSLNNGRLYNQATSMCRYYKRPILLIEFDPNKPFSLQGKYALSSEINSTDTSSKLSLLTLHFPRLRILWCQSPYATAELFEDLKIGRPQPDAAMAMSITGEMESDLVSGKYSHGPQNVLLKAPGINTKNVATLMNKVHDLAELVRLSEKELTDIMGSQPHAKSLWRFLHHKHIPTDNTVNTKTNTAHAPRPHYKKSFTGAASKRRK